MDENAALRNFKDFLLQYNRISESCFVHCVNDLTVRAISPSEALCAELCTKKHVRVNHKVIQTYMEVQPQMMNKRIEELSQKSEMNPRLETVQS